MLVLSALLINLSLFFNVLHGKRIIIRTFLYHVVVLKMSENRKMFSLRHATPAIKRFRRRRPVSFHNYIFVTGTPRKSCSAIMCQRHIFDASSSPRCRHELDARARRRPLLVDGRVGCVRRRQPPVRLNLPVLSRNTYGEVLSNCREAKRCALPSNANLMSCDLFGV